MTKWSILVGVLAIAGCGTQVVEATESPVQAKPAKSLFQEIGKSDAEITAKLDGAWKQLFYGDDESQRVYYPVGDDMATIRDIGSRDVRSEGMSYGMMIAVQLNKREEFDRLWKWSKTYMQHQSGVRKGYFAWHCEFDGKKKSQDAAPDGEEYFVTALLFADSRWGSGSGIKNYKAEAQAILHQMIHKETENGGQPETVTNMFNLKEKQVVFVPSGDAAKFTDPSYHLPGFYEIWAKAQPKDAQFWTEAAATSRAFFKKAAHPKTGLFPDYSSFEGKPMKAPWDPNNRSDNFLYDAMRVQMNIAMDHMWFKKDPWQVEQSNRILEFFASQKPSYVSSYTVDGKPLVEYKSAGLIAMNSITALSATTPKRLSFVQELWDAQIPTGQWRYYDGMMYMFGLLYSSGEFKKWTP